MKVVVVLSEDDMESYKILMRCGLGNSATRKIINGTPLPECKNCRFFEYDSVARVDGVPLILGHEVCKKWGDGCKTREDGYCFLFEAKEIKE